MVKSNGHCGAGVANECHLGGIKVDVNHLSELGVSNALGYNNSYIDIYSISWGPPHFGHTVNGPGPLIQSTLANGVKNVI